MKQEGSAKQKQALIFFMSSDKLAEQRGSRVAGANESLGVLHHQVPLCPKSFTHKLSSYRSSDSPLSPLHCGRMKKTHLLLNRELELGIIL